jgi:hypothetical protein
MSSIVHLLCKDFSWIKLARDVNNLEESILNPFADHILAHFHVADLLSCHVMQPFDARLVVVVNRRSGLSISNVMTAGSNTVDKMAITITNFETSLVAPISALHELHSWQAKIHMIGPP